MKHTGQKPNGKDLTSIFQQKYQDYFFEVQDKLSCPNCQNPCGLKFHGQYPRHLYLSSTQRIKIRVSRLICTCGKTFVVLPPEIIPFKRYLLNQVLSVLRLARTRSRYYIEQRLEIATSVVSRWLVQYQARHQSLAKVMNLLALDNDEAARTYNRMRPTRRFMQIISPWTQPFHALV